MVLTFLYTEATEHSFNKSLYREHKHCARTMNNVGEGLEAKASYAKTELQFQKSVTH